MGIEVVEKKEEKFKDSCGRVREVINDCYWVEGDNKYRMYDRKTFNFVGKTDLKLYETHVIINDYDGIYNREENKIKYINDLECFVYTRTYRYSNKRMTNLIDIVHYERYFDSEGKECLVKETHFDRTGYILSERTKITNYNEDGSVKRSILESVENNTYTTEILA